jgi:zinc transporter 1
MTDPSLAHFMFQAQRIGECLHAYGIHSVTLQPELGNFIDGASGVDHGNEGHELRRRREANSTCQIACGSGCEPLTCCG